MYRSKDRGGALQRSPDVLGSVNLKKGYLAVNLLPMGVGFSLEFRMPGKREGT
jgi:hypothetical protein